MEENEFMLKLVAMLDMAKSKKQVNSQVKELEKSIRNLRLTVTLLKGESKKNLNQIIKQFEGQLNYIKLQAKIDTKNIKSDVDKALQNISFKDLKDIDIGVDTGKTKLKIQKVIADAKKVAQNSSPITVNVDLKKEKLSNDLTAYLSRNSKVKESEPLLKEADKLREKIAGINDRDSLRNVTQEFQLFKSEVSATGYQAKSTSDRIKGLIGNATKLGSAFGLASTAISNYQKSLKTIRELDDILTEISKTSNSTKQELEELGNSSFDTASKFGKVASDYLTAIQEMNRSGFYGEAGKALGELSLLTQAAGDVTAETAQKYLLSTNAAYGYAGSAEKLNAVLDGQNTITNKWSVDMETMATATEKAGSMAANTGVKIEELSAMIGTISARTKEAGSITGNGIKALLVNLQNISSDKITSTLEKANASMTETVNGVEKLRTPIAILKDLAKTYNSLDESDPLKSEITTNIGGKHHSNQLSALLSGWADYEKMLVDYSNGAGSALEEADKSANNLTGRLNALQNSWDALVNSITSKSAIKGGVGFLDGLLQSATKLVETFDVLPVALASVTAFMTAKNKDYGISQIFNEDGKFDVQGNFMGIDISSIKHYREASAAVEKWNSYLKAGKTDINDFGEAVVKNNSQLREYLKTCSVDAPASLKGYKAHLQAAGEATTSLRLGTILLNTVLSFGLGLAIQGVITGISKLASASDDIAEKAKQIGEAYKSTQSEISGYKEKIEELHKTINSSSSSIEEVTAARQSLMDIQGEMIEKYGSEKEVIDMVTDAVNNQADAFDRLSEKKYQESVNEFNKSGFWEGVANSFSGYSDNMDRMVSEMEEPVTLNLTSAANRNKEEYERFEKIISQYGKLGTGKTGNGVDFFNIELSGGLDSVYEKLLKIQETASGFDFGSNDFNKSLTNLINGTKEKLDKYSELYDSYILKKKILSKSGMENGYDKSFENINNAMKKYTEAKLDGGEEKIRSAGEEYASILTEELSKISPDDENVKNYLQNLYPEMQEIVGGWDLQYDLKANPDSGTQLRDAFGKFSGTNEIKKYDVSASNDPAKNEAYAFLEGYADKYNLTLDQLIDKSQELGFVQDENYNELVNKFGEGNIKKLTPDELEIAYKIKNTGNMSFEDLQKAIEETKKKAEESAKVSFKQAWKSLDNVGSDSDQKDLKKDLLELAKQGKLTVAEFNKTLGAKSWLKETALSAEEAVKKINNLKEVSSADQLSSMKSGISSITNILGDKKENLSDKKTKKTGIGVDTLGSMPEDIKSCTKAYENFCEVLGNGASTMADCKDAANKLATAYVNSNNFLAQLTESNKDYYISVLNEMGVENADIIVKSVLKQKEAELSAEKQWARATTISLTDATYDEITALANEQRWSEETKNALYRLALQKQTVNGVSLNTTADIDSLSAMVDAIGGTTTALAALKKLMENPSSVSTPEMADAVRKAKAEIETAKNKSASVQPNIPKISVQPTGYNPSSGTGKNKKDKAQKAKESKQEIDWLSRMLDMLQNKVDILKAKFENLFSVGKKDSNLNSQIQKTEKLLKVQGKAEERYRKKADSYYKKNKKKLSQNGITLSMLQNGSYDIKSYKQGIADIIQAYEEYYDKAQESKKATIELAASIKELSKQKLEIKLEDNERKRTYQEARYANAKTADAKNKILGKEIDTYNSDDRAYNRYYKRAVQSRNKDGKEAKTAVSKVKGLSKKDKNNIKKLIKKGQAIPSALMKKVEKYNASAYKKLADYNNSVDFVADALRDKKLANEENKTNRREKKAEQHQNRADEAEAKYNVKQQREANAATAKEKNKYEAASMKYLKTQYKHLIEIAKLEGDTTEQKRLQLELDEKIAESYKTRYDNIKTEYENKTGLNDAQIATVQAQIATLEAAGKSATKEIYEGMMKVSADTKEKLLKERAELEEAGKKFEYGSEEWYAWQNDLLAIGQQMESCTQNTIEFQKAINELDLKKFSLIAAQLDATQSHLDFLVNMLSHKDLVSKESGGFTDEGIAAISLRFSDMENKETIVKNAQNTLKKLYGQHLRGIDGLNEEEFLAKREEQLDIIRDSIEAIADEKDAILDLVEDAIQVQIDAINELIEKKRKALQSEKDLYEYQKKVAKQTKNIALIQKQIAALSGDKSEEAQARLQKLKVSLEEAQQDLKDTEYDKWLSDQEDMLDDLADEMEDFWENIINELRDDINGSMDKLTQMVSDNPEAVARALDTLGLGDALSVITAYNKDDTHTDKTTDYGGSSYSSTYDDKIGTNVNNTFKTSIDDLVASTGKVSDSAEELAKRAEEEAKRKADQERIAKQKADQERFAKQKKEDAKMEAYKRADSIMEQVYNGSKSVSVTSAPKEGVQAIVEEFLNSSALHKPKSEKEKKRIKTDPLLKYISENYSGKTLSLANEIKLGAYLGIPVSSKDKVTSSEANKILKAFKGAGFSEGGIVSEINKAIKENGDDGIATVKKGEAFLTPKQTEAMQEQAEAVQDLSERYVRVGSGLTPEQEDYLKSFISTSPIPTQTVENMEKMTKAFDVNNNYSKSANVSVGEVHVHLDGSNIVDKESFRKTLRDYEVRSDIEQIALGDLTLKKGSVRNSMRYI